MPIAIASPCKSGVSVSRYKLSIACPIVCPKLSAFRQPFSKGSASTTAFFIFNDGINFSAQFTFDKSVICFKTCHCFTSTIKAC